MSEETSPPLVRLAAVATHPIQYQAHLWRTLAASSGVEIKVFFATPHGAVPARDPGFGKSFSWDIPLLDGYEYEFLKSSHLPGVHGPVANRFPRELDGKIKGVLDELWSARSENSDHPFCCG